MQAFIHVSRDDLATRIIRILQSGCLVCVAGRVFALRRRNEVIGDGENAGICKMDGLFERLNGMRFEGDTKTPFRHWSLSASEMHVRDRILEALGAHDDYNVALLDVGLTASCALTKGEIGEALRSGTRLAEPPTDILGDTPAPMLDPALFGTKTAPPQAKAP